MAVNMIAEAYDELAHASEPDAPVHPSIDLEATSLEITYGDPGEDEYWSGVMAYRPRGATETP